MAAEIISRAEAQARGLKRYFTGLECSHGHVAERQTSNGVCIGCRYDIEKRWKARNPEKFRDKVRRQATRHRAENPERIRRNRNKWDRENQDKRREIEKRCRRKNPDIYRAKEKRWRAANKDKVAKKNRRYKRKHAERLKPIAIERTAAWRKTNPEGVRRNSNMRRARKQNAPGSFTAEQTLDLLHRQKFRCAACGTSIKKKRHLDHIVALSRGGSNDIANLQWLCVTCNCSKHNKDPIVWARERGRLL